MRYSPSRASVGRWVAALAAAVVIATGQADAGPRGHAKLDRALRDAIGRGATEARIIIRLTDNAKPEVKRRLAKYGRALNKEHKGIGAASAMFPVAALAELEEVDGVAGISIDAPIKSHSVLNYATAATLKQSLQVTYLNQNGSGVTVAVIDSGIAPLADFGTRIKAFYDFTGGNGAVAKTPFDDYGHGTHVAGLIGGSGSGSLGT